MNSILRQHWFKLALPALLTAFLIVWTFVIQPVTPYNDDWALWPVLLSLPLVAAVHIYLIATLRPKWPLLGYAAVHLLALVLIVAICDKWSERRIAESMRRGDIVCQAVEAYRVKHGKYPFELEDLQPEFLREIPQPTAGDKEWEYTVIDNGTNYWLHVSASEWGPQLGRTGAGGWEYMDDHGLRNI